MRPDNKLANHGKQDTSDGRPQIPSVIQQQQAAAGHLGPKGAGAGSHGVKTNQIPSGNPGLKAVGQSVSSVGGMLKTKSKRERSVSIDSGDARNAIPPSLETDAKGEGVMRSKRRCVLEKKQPYSGDEWCSGPDTEEDEDKPHTTHRERVLAVPIQGLSDRPSDPGGPVMGCGVGTGLKAEPPQPSQQVVYVFTTNLANCAAEAVIKGQTDSILLFHQQNVPHTKLEQGHPAGKLSSLSDKMSCNSSPPMGTPKSQSGTPQPASVGMGGHLHPAGTPSSSAGHSDNESSHNRSVAASSNSISVVALKSEGGIVATPTGTIPGTGDGAAGAMPLPVANASPSGSPSVLSAHLQSDPGQRSGPVNTDGLSKEQLEHRERSLQTLETLERLLLHSGPGAGPGDPGGPNTNAVNNSSNLSNNTDRRGILEDSENGTNNADNCNVGNILPSALAPMAGMKKYEEPLQSIISQTQSLGGPAMDSPQMEPHHNLPQHSHHQLPSPGLDMGPLLGSEGLTPEQVAWRKLQEEYYLEKRRQQEIQPQTHPQHFRMMAEMGMHGGPMIMRGPPPPYHSKPGDPQWGPGAMMGGGMGGNARMIEMHQEGPRGPRFLGQIQRGPLGGGGFPGSPGSGISVEGLGTQRPNRPGMMWLDDMPSNMGGGGPFHGCYPGGPGGPPQHLQGDPERLLTREEMFRIMEKRQIQGLHRFDLNRLAKQQQGSLGSRILDSSGVPDFPNLGMGRGPHSARSDPMEFTGSREMMGSPVGEGSPQMRDLVDSALGSNLNLSINAQINSQQQQHQQLLLSQKLQGVPGGGVPLGEILSPREISRIRAGRGRNKIMISGPDGPFQFPNAGPFSGGQAQGPYLQQPGHEMFSPDQQSAAQMGGTSRLSHIPMTGVVRGAELGPRHPSELALNVNPMNSPVMPPPHQLKSPSLGQDPSSLLHSPSTPGLKSPSQVSSAVPHPPLPPASGAGTPSSSIKSPQVLGSSNLGLHSPSVSPGRLKSPAMPVGSPGWTSPKTALPSPGVPNNGKVVGNGGSSSTETGPSLPPRSSNSTPISQPGSMNPSLPFASSPDAPPTQNPLSLIMSRMSKYAMPSSTPLYHDAIKTIAASDDEMLPDRPLLSGVSIGGNLGNQQASQMLVSQSSIGPHSDPQSPMGIPMGQQDLPHDASEAMLSSPNPMGMPTMSSAMMGPNDGMGPCNVSPMSQNQMAAFVQMQPPSHGPMHSPIGGMSQTFSQSNDEVLPPQQLHLLNKGHPHQRTSHPSDSFASLPMGDGPDLSEVIRPSHTGIPEFDLSRIIPSDKPSSTLQYFPKSEPHHNPHPGQSSQQQTPQQLLKQLSSAPPHSSGSSSNPHLANLQNMMAEQQLPPQPSRQNMGISHGGSRGMIPVGGMGPMCPPGHMMGRTGMVHPQHQQQQAMMPNSLLHHPSHPYPGVITSQQHSHNLIAQQNIMMMQAKQRSMSLSGDPFGPQGPLMSPQGPMLGPPHPQSGMMGPQSLRQRGMSLDSPVGYGPGGMANMPF